MTRLSDKGAKFIAKHEGFVSKAYRDPVGVLTIGTGFTNRSALFKKYWIETRGRELKPGDTISRDENNRILKIIADGEYGNAVHKYIDPNLPQHQYDGATSVVFNMGPKSATYRWASALSRGDVQESARLLRSGYNKAGGRVLKGLTNRRHAEANLIEKGDYGAGGSHVYVPRNSGANPHLKEYQEKLNKLGYGPLDVDGISGPKTTNAVMRFQETHPNLVNDGLLGRATATAIDRALEGASKGTKAAVTGVVGTAAVTVAQEGFNVLEAVPYLAGASALVTVLVLGYIAYRYRDEIKQWFNK